MSTISRACGEPLLGTVRLRVWLLLIFTVLLGLMHWLYANQGALLYLYYLPVIAAAMVLRAVADAFDALVSDRPYRKGVGTFVALTSIQVGRGSHFDPDVVDALQRIVDREGESAAAPDTGSYAAAP